MYRSCNLKPAMGNVSIVSCSASTTTLSSASEVSALAECSTFSGSVVAIADGVADDDGSIALDGVEVLEGSLNITAVSSLSRLSSNSLRRIDGILELSSLEGLTAVSFPALLEVGEIRYTNLTRLTDLNFKNGLPTTESISISNTALRFLRSTTSVEQAKDIVIENNTNLQDIAISVDKILNDLRIADNGKNLSLSLPTLQWTSTTTIDGCTSVNMPELVTLNTSGLFINNTVRELSLPKLQKCGDSINSFLSFSLNNELRDLSLPQLEDIVGSLTTFDNYDLDLLSFPALRNIEGSISFHGNFSE